MRPDERAEWYERLESFLRLLRGWVENSKHDYYHAVIRQKNHEYLKYQARTLFEEEEGMWPSIKYRLEQLAPSLPAAEKDLSLCKEIDEKILPSYYEVVSRMIANQRYPSLLGEYAALLGSICFFLFHLYGSYYIRKRILTQGKTPASILSPFKGPLHAYLAKKLPLYYYDAGEEIKEGEFESRDSLEDAVIVEILIDSQNTPDHFLLGLMQARKRNEQEKIAKEYVPEIGVEKVVIEGVEVAARKMEDAFRRGRSSEACRANNLSARIERGKAWEYYQKLFPPPNYYF
jgi:hypothetical protein